MAKVNAKERTIVNAKVNDKKTVDTKESKDTNKNTKIDTKESKPELKTKYLALQKDLKNLELPDFDTLDKYFEIDVIDATVKHVIKEIAKKVFDDIDMHRKMLEGILQPDMSILAMQEAEFLNEQDHEQVLEMGRQLMRLDRKFLVTILQNNDEAYVEFIKDALKTWIDIQLKLLPIAKRLEKGWENKHKNKQSQHYLG